MFECFHCGKSEHTRSFCYKFIGRIKQLKKTRKYFIKPSKFQKVWISKKDMYNKYQEQVRTEIENMYEELYLLCNLTIVQLEDDEDDDNVIAKAGQN